MSSSSREGSPHPKVIVVTPAPSDKETPQRYTVEFELNQQEEQSENATVDVPPPFPETSFGYPKGKKLRFPLPSTTESIIDESTICPIVPSSRPTTAVIDTQLLSDVLAMRPTLVLGRSERARTAGVLRRSAKYRSLPQRTRPVTAPAPENGGELRRRSSLPVLSNPSSVSDPIVIEDITKDTGSFDDEDDVFTRGNLRKSTRRINERIKTYRREQLMPKEIRRSCLAHFKYVQWPKIKSKLQVARSWELWKGHMKEVEGHFGTAVVSYFIFLRWLFIMNIVIFAFWFGFVVIPNAIYISIVQPPNIPSGLSCSYNHLSLPSPNYTCSEDFSNGALVVSSPNVTFYPLSGFGFICNVTNDTFSIRTCLFESQTIGGVVHRVANQESPQVVTLSRELPTDCRFKNITAPQPVRLCSSNIMPHVEWYQYIIDFFLGQGIFNDTVLFHGRYSESTVFVYNLPLAFMLLIVVVYAISITLLVYNLGKAYNESYVQFGRKRHINFCNKVISAWDYNITDVNTANLKKVQIKTELQEELADFEQRNIKRDREELAKVIVIRIFTNLFTVIVLAGGGVAIFYTAQFSLTTQSSSSVINLEGLVSPIVITSFNLILPFVFSFLAQFERFKTQSGEIKMTLFRTIVVRLSSLIVLIATLYIVIQCTQTVESIVSASEGSVSSTTCGLSSVNITTILSGVTTTRDCPVCWESYIGQEFYKLAVTNILISSASTIGVETARNVVSRIKWKGIGEKIGKGNFNIPKSILDLIYTQALLWLGFIFTPLTPAIILATTFVLFYIKKYSLVWNLTPSKRKSFRAARTNFVFIALMLLTLFLVIIIVGFAIASLRPSSICGPFRGQTFMYSIITDLIAEIENCSARAALEYFGSFGFLLPVFVLLLLVIYAQQVILKARKKRFNLIKKQLILEGANVTHIVSTLDEMLNKVNTTDGKMDPEEHSNLKNRMERIRNSSVGNMEMVVSAI